MQSCGGTDPYERKLLIKIFLNEKDRCFVEWDGGAAAAGK